MNFESYQTTKLAYNAYRFFSEGKRTEKMLIAMQPMPQGRKFYNLAFGVWNEENNKINDKIELKNGDTNKILATVGLQALAFVDENPDINLMATGSVEKDKLRARTRMYQMGISANYEYLVQKYEIFGLIANRDANGEIVGRYPLWPGKWQPFEKGTNYDAFLLHLKR